MVLTLSTSNVSSVVQLRFGFVGALLISVTHATEMPELLNQSLAKVRGSAI